MLRLKVGIPLVCFLFTLIFGKFEFCYVKSLILWIRLNPLLDSRLYSVLYCIQYVRTYTYTQHLQQQCKTPSFLGSAISFSGFTAVKHGSGTNAKCFYVSQSSKFPFKTKDDAKAQASANTY